MGCSLRGLCLLSVVAWLGLWGERDGPRSAAAQSHSVVSGGLPAVDYAGTWEYRYGDSPRDAAGQLEWAKPTNGAAANGWQSTTQLSTPPGRAGMNYLWLRTRIVPPPGYHPLSPSAGNQAANQASADNALTLFSYNIDDSYEAYLDGVLIARFGSLDPPTRVFRGTPRVMLALGQNSAGRFLTLRIHSQYGWIGVFGTPRIGSPSAILRDVLDRGLSPALTGFFAMLLGLASLALFAMRRRDWVYLYYGGFAVSAGMNLILRSLLRDLVLPLSPVWTYAEILSASGVVSSLAGYIAQVFGAGPLRIVSRLGQAMVLFTLISMALVATGTLHIWQTILPIQSGCLVLVIGVGLVALLELRRTQGDGKVDGRILAIGVCSACSIELFELLMVMGILPRYRLLIAHYAVACIVLCLGLILVLRFSRLHRRMQSYANVMQLSLSSVRVLEPGQHMQVALTEVLRLLGGSRALIFEREPADAPVHRSPRNVVLSRSTDLLGTPLWLAAGRDASGHAIRENQHDPLDYDVALIADVLRRRRPAIVMRERDKLDESADQLAGRERLSIAAAPLLTRGDPFGVLYLESDAAHQIYTKDDLEILLGLCNQVALALMTTHTVRLELESELARRRLAEQSDLLAAAARMAGGDLQSTIVVPKASELEPLARALEAMRQDLQFKFEKLATSNKEIQQLNDELRRQIENRSQRLMEALLRGTEARKGGLVVPGKLLGDHYQVLRTLGRGAMGTVYEVERVSDQRHFAAKVLSEQGDRMALMRFAREGQILARLDHPNLVSIVDIDITEGGTLFLVMELVRGTTLKLCHERFRDPRLAVPLLRQIADGLNAIHARGIVHRDLKPANVLIAEIEGDEQGAAGLRQVKLADFGVSTLLGSIDDTTEHGSEQGRPERSEPKARTPEPALAIERAGPLRPAGPLEFETTREQVRLAPEEAVDDQTATVAPTAAVGSSPRTTAHAEDDPASTDSEAEPPNPAHLTQTGILIGTL